MAKAVGAITRWGMVSLTVMGLAACSDSGKSQSSSAAPPPSTAPAPTAPVAQVTIRDVQTALQQAGYYKGGKIDGIWGRGTQRAVTRYQHDHKLTASGKLDVPTLQALNLTGAPPSTSGTANPVPPPPPGPASTPADSNAGAQPAPGR